MTDHDAADERLRAYAERWRANEAPAPAFDQDRLTPGHEHRSRRALWPAGAGAAAAAVAAAVVIAIVVGSTLVGHGNTKEPTPASTSGPSPSASAHPQPTLTQIVHDPKSMLYAVSIHHGPIGYTVSAWWTFLRGNHVYNAIVTSDDGFETAHYEPGGWDSWSKYQPLTKKVPAPALDAFKGLLASPVRSLAPHTRAFVAGGDGATLLPFEAVARSVGGGDWQAYTVPKTHGDQAYDEGDLVLPDGRFLVLLDAWSSDRGMSKPGPEYHGLWISAGDDWAHYTPFKPTFAPALQASDTVSSIEPQTVVGAQAPNGLVVATTRANMLYVSTDGAATFRRIRAR